MEWYYDTGAGPEGPVDEEAITRMLSDGTLSPQTLVRKEGREEWRPVGDLYEFEGLAPAGGDEPASQPVQTPEPVSNEAGQNSTEALQAIVKPIKQLSVILWFAFTSSIIMYLVMVVMLSKKADGVVALDATLVTGASIAAVIAGLAGLFYRRHAFAEATLRRKFRDGLAQPRFSDPPPTPAAAKQQARYHALSGDDQQVFLLIRSLLVPRIICIALFEAVAIFGVVLGFMSKDATMTIPFVVVAIGLNVTVFPKIDALRKRAEGWR